MHEPFNFIQLDTAHYTVLLKNTHTKLIDLCKLLRIYSETKVRPIYGRTVCAG